MPGSANPPASSDEETPRTYERDESDATRLDRNFNELLQELRVAQTGVQILFAFLLSIAFQHNFSQLREWQRDLYIGTLVSAAVAAVLIIAPVATHRVLFRQHRKDTIVDFSARLAVAGLVFLAIAIVAAVFLVSSYVGGVAVAIGVSVVVAVVVTATWAVAPMRLRRKLED
jgi:O-antigen/teichoic acid export membrane protein